MAPAQDANIIDEVKARNDIVDVISEYVTLKRTGKNYVGLCPFHLEKTPSFTVAPDKQMFYCFGCHASGDVVTFVMKKESKGFYEALKILADRAGVALPDTQLPPAEAAAVKRRQTIYSALSHGADLYSRWLKEDQGKAALAYLKGRGLTEDTIERFGLGYAPDAWDELAQSLKRHGTGEDILIASGLCLARQKGSGVYDRFRNRAVFPIRDLRGRTIGFGARSLDGSEPKYINSPETEVFSKGRGLFALNLARDAARDETSIVVVEGYMDAISAHQAGVRNVVASLGTALTREQARGLVQISQSVVIAYDSDSAGQSATMRGLEVLREAGASVRVGIIPEGKDPDDFIRAKGSDAFRQVLKDAPTVVEFLFDLYRARFGEARAGRIRVVEAMVPLLVATENPVELSEYIRMIAGRTGMAEAGLQAEVARQQRRPTRTSPGGRPLPGDKTGLSRNTKTEVADLEKTTSADTPAEIQAERMLLSLMISDPRCKADALRTLRAELFTGERVRIFEALKNPEFDRTVDVAVLVERVGDDLEALVGELAVEEHPGEQAERFKITKDCTLVLKKRRLRKLYTEIQCGAPGTEGFERLFGEYQGLLRETKK